MFRLIELVSLKATYNFGNLKTKGTQGTQLAHLYRIYLHSFSRNDCVKASTSSNMIEDILKRWS